MHCATVQNHSNNNVHACQLMISLGALQGSNHQKLQETICQKKLASFHLRYLVSRLFDAQPLTK